jgi:Tol biopolymer transport system component
VFLFDRSSNATTRVSVGTGGSQANGACDPVGISDDGNVIAFLSDATNLVTGDTNVARDVFVYDRGASTTVRASVGADGAEANAPTTAASMSADGIVVVFESAASNLVPQDTNGVSDVFLRRLR